MAERILRVLVSSPSYAGDIRQRAEGVIGGINTAFAGKARIERVDGASATSDTHCDAVVAILSPRPAASQGNDDGTREAATSQAFAAIDRRPADAAFPDICIFRDVGPFPESTETQSGWKAAKSAFENWAKAKGCAFLSFENFAYPTDFETKLDGQLRSWLKRLGMVATVEAFEPADTAAQPAKAPPLSIFAGPAQTGRLVDVEAEEPQPRRRWGPLFLIAALILAILAAAAFGFRQWRLHRGDRQTTVPAVAVVVKPVNPLDGQKARADAALASAKTSWAQGNAASALQAATEARQAYQTLSSSDAKSAEWQRGLSASNAIAGDALVALGRLDDGLTAYRDSAASAKTLISANPDSAASQDLAATDDKIAKVSIARKRFEDGVGAYRDALSVRQALSRKDAESADLRRAVIESEVDLGDGLAVQGNLDDALIAYRESLTDAGAMASKNPADARWRRALAVSNAKIGDAQAGRQRFDDALAAYREAIAIVQGLASKEPDNTEWQSLLSTGNERIGDVFVMEGHLESGLSAYRDELAILKTLAGKEPESQTWQLGLSECQERIGDVLSKQGRTGDAIEADRQGIAALWFLAQKEPENSRWQRSLMVGESKIGQLLMLQTRREEALATYRHALAIAKAMEVKEPDTNNWQNAQAVIDSNIGALLVRLDRRDEALDTYRDALALARPLVSREPDNIEYQTSLVISLYNLADAGEDTAPNLTEALDTLKRLDAAGTLPAGNKELITVIKDKLAKLKSPPQLAKAANKKK